jgi:hypothetical protein
LVSSGGAARSHPPIVTVGSPLLLEPVSLVVTPVSLVPVLVAEGSAPESELHAPVSLEPPSPPLDASPLDAAPSLELASLLDPSSGGAADDGSRVGPSLLPSPATLVVSVEVLVSVPMAAVVPLLELLLASVSTDGSSQRAATHCCAASQSEFRRHSARRQPASDNNSEQTSAGRIRTSP